MTIQNRLRELNHNAILMGILLVALLLNTVALCMGFLMNGSVDPSTATWQVLIIGAMWYFEEHKI